MAQDFGPQPPFPPAAPVHRAAPVTLYRAESEPERDPGPVSVPQAAPLPADTPTPTAVRPDEEQGPSIISRWLRESPSWLVSLVLHMAILVALALWMLPAEVKETFGLLSVPLEAVEEIEEIVEVPLEKLDMDVEQVTQVQPQVQTNNVQPEAMVAAANDAEAAVLAVELSDVGLETAPQNDLMQQVGSVAGSGFVGRGKAARQALSRQGGGSPDSDKAVALALRWLAAHQHSDGGWSFDHRIGLCQGRCPDHGRLGNGARNGATAMALLPFLGAGQTHKEGDYQKVVAAGLYFLMRSMDVSDKGGSLTDGGNMYSHGLASIVLCEAYAMTQDKNLMAPAQASINFIVYAQDPVGGGWRYAPRQPGDTSVVGWQVMALKSAHMAYLHVPPLTVKGASHFLDTVQGESGASYGYTGPGGGGATTAVGLLCRMYLGWKQDHPGLTRGVETMARQGPSLRDLYRDYYAAQVMFQATGAKGDIWKTWNDKMRDGLVSTQSRQGHTEGSWYIAGGHSDSGGRLYCTSLATLILEVYYRHMPIFREAATQDDFPLE